MPTIAFHTLGCKLNYAESSQLARQFVEAGYSIADYGDRADVYVINTCTVTAVAEKKCRTAIRQAKRQNADAEVAVIGCFAQNEPELVSKIEGVTIVAGNHDKMRLLQIVQERLAASHGGAAEIHHLKVPHYFAPAYSSGDRTRAFFKVQDGCDYFCTYCAIPFARGRSRSATAAETVAKARELAATGVKEVVLTGVNTGTFGKDNGETFLDLIEELDKVQGIERYRISSIEPNLITNEIIDFVAASRAFLPHFHIPLQAGSDKVLELMHRHYDTAMYAEKLHYIKQVMPHACIAADIMAGFYGEGEQQFDETCSFVEALPISYLHVFTYSERPNTAALRLEGRVPMDERRRRSHVLQQISQKKKAIFYLDHLGESRTVLWESNNDNGYMMGFTDNYIRLKTHYCPTLVNTLQQVAIGKDNLVADFDE